MIEDKQQETSIEQPEHTAIRMRICAHDIFDELWKSGLMSRSQAYHWLANRMSMIKDKAHIKNFDTNQCKQVISLSEDMLKKMMSIRSICGGCQHLTGCFRYPKFNVKHCDSYEKN